MVAKWSDISANQLIDTATPSTNAIAVLPLGATEAHGPHLPIGTDTILAERLLDQAEAVIEVNAVSMFRLPALWLGASTEHADQPGTVSCEAEQLISSVMVVAESVYRAGIRKLLLFNAHGGNISALNIAALKVRRAYGLLAVPMHWLDFDLPETLAKLASIREDVHGGWLETSLMLYLAPEFVTMRNAEANKPRQPSKQLYPNGPIQWGWMTSDLAEGGWVGQPELATAEIGRQLAQHIASNVATLIRELSVCTWDGEPKE